MTIIKIAEITFEYLLIKLFDFDFIPIKFPIKINIKLKINVNIVANSTFIPEMLAAIPVAMLLTDNATIIFIMSFYRLYLVFHLQILQLFYVLVHLLMNLIPNI